MDCDLQEAPEDIPRLWAAAGEGYDIVRTVRRGWRHSAFRRTTSRAYRRLTLETDVRPDYSNLSLLSRRVVDAFLRLHDRDREYMIALDWLGFDSTTVEIEHHERHAGESGYTLRRLIRIATRRDVLPQHGAAEAGRPARLRRRADRGDRGRRSRSPTTSSKRTSACRATPASPCCCFVLAGFIIVSVGVVGLYVGRIFEQVKDRPLFLIDQEAPRSTYTLSRPPGIGNDFSIRSR